MRFDCSNESPMIHVYNEAYQRCSIELFQTKSDGGDSQSNVDLDKSVATTLVLRLIEPVFRLGFIDTFRQIRKALTKLTENRLKGLHIVWY